MTLERLEPGLDVLASLVLEDGRRWGEAAADFQWDDARAVLDPEAPPYAFLTRARGASKTTDLAGVALAAMLTQIPDHSNAYALAADRDQGRILVDAAEGFIRRTPGLRGSFDVSAWRISAKNSGITLEVLAADAAGAWGLRPAFTIVDEIGQWSDTPIPKRLWEAVSTSAAKLPGARLVVLTTASAPEHWSFKILGHARSNGLWHTSEVPGPAPWMDPERLEEQRARLPESSFRRLFMNEWTEGEDSLTTADALRDCVTLDGPLERRGNLRYLIGLDLGIKKDRTVAAVCHTEPVGTADVDGLPQHKVVLDRMQVWAGTRAEPVRLEDVEEWIVQASETYNGAGVIADPWQAVGLAQRLRSRGVSVEEFPFTAQSNTRLATTLHVLLRDRRVALPDDDELIDELANVKLVETRTGTLRLDHDPSRHNDRAVALALAAHKLTQRAGRVRPKIRVNLPAGSSEMHRLRRWPVATSTEDG